MATKSTSGIAASEVRCLVDHSILAPSDRILLDLETDSGVIRLALSQAAAESLGERLTDLAFDLESAKDDLEFERDLQEADDWFETKDDLIVDRSEEVDIDDLDHPDEDDMIGRHDLRRHDAAKETRAAKSSQEDSKRSMAVLLALFLLLLLFAALLALSMGRA